MTKHKIITITILALTTLFFAGNLWFSYSLLASASGDYTIPQAVWLYIATVTGGIGGFLILFIVASGYSLLPEKKRHISAGMVTGVSALVLVGIALISLFFIKDESGFVILGVYAQIATFLCIGGWLCFAKIASRR